MYMPFFRFGCTLEINSQRTAAYLLNADTECDTSGIEFTCDCSPLHWAVPDDPDDPPSLVTYHTPEVDSVEWYSPDVPESAGFLGYVVESVEQKSVVSRNIVTRITGSGGGVLGPIRPKERRFDFTVLLFACNELSMEYGFRFLQDSLAGSGCDAPCTLCDAEFRDSCPPVGNDPTWADLNKPLCTSLRGRKASRESV